MFLWPLLPKSSSKVLYQNSQATPAWENLYLHISRWNQSSPRLECAPLRLAWLLLKLSLLMNRTTKVQWSAKVGEKSSPRFTFFVMILKFHYILFLKLPGYPGCCGGRKAWLALCFPTSFSLGGFLTEEPETWACRQIIHFWKWFQGTVVRDGDWNHNRERKPIQ